MNSSTFPAHLDNLAPIVEFVETELDEHDCPPKAMFQIEVAIEEIFVNIVNYAGLTSNEGVEVRCEVLTDPLRVVIQFLDDGTPFDPLAKEDPDITPEGTENREGGLGIFMVKQMMDDVAYAYENGKNTLTIQKHLS